MKTKVDGIHNNLTKSIAILVVLTAAFDVDAFAARDAQERRQQPYQAQPPAQPSEEPNAPNVLVTPDEDYRIGSGDVIDIKVEDAPELSGKFRVSAAGTFLMPHLGRIKAQQKTTEELTAFIAEGLRGGYLKEPRVTVAVQQINSHLFFVQGAVRRPGVYQIEGRPSLLKLITVAGGLADNHGTSAFIMHEISSPKSNQPTVDAVPPAEVPAPTDANSQTVDVSQTNTDSQTEESAKYELTKVNINGLLKGRFDQNVSIAPGSIINIPTSDVFFVAGEVQSPGSFPLKDGTTLRQAISLAAGTTFKAATGRGIIFREDLATGQRQEIKVNIGDVMSGKNEDVAIMANDIIIVPNSRLKTVSRSLLEAFGVSAVRIPGRY